MNDPASVRMPAGEDQIARILESARRLDAKPANIRFLAHQITGRRIEGDTVEAIARALSYGEAAKMMIDLRRRHGK